MTTSRENSGSEFEIDPLATVGYSPIQEAQEKMGDDALRNAHVLLAYKEEPDAETVLPQIHSEREVYGCIQYARYMGWYALAEQLDHHQKVIDWTKISADNNPEAPITDRYRYDEQEEGEGPFVD